jgi:hypothetical protein
VRFVEHETPQTNLSALWAKNNFSCAPMLVP